MRMAIVFVVVAAVVLLAGCGSKDTEVEKQRAGENQGLDRLNEQVRVLSVEVRRMREDLRELDGDLFDLKSQLDLGVASTRGGGETTAAAGTGGGTTSAAGLEEVPVEPIEANLEILAVELAKTRADVKTLSQAYAADKELEELRDPRRTWEAMGDADKLTGRLDRLAKSHATGIEDEATRELFLADIATLKDEIAVRASTPREEQLETYKAGLAERISAETNERRRQWYERQLASLTGEDEEAVERQLDFAMRGDNARQLGEFARKYEIPRETLSDNGLRTFGGMGGRMGGRGGGDRGGGRGGARGGG